MSRDWKSTKVRHGTHSGWSLHCELGERPCDPCYRAKQSYDADWRGQPRRAQLSRLHARAQQRAYGELSRRHKAEYDELYRSHRDAIRAAEEENITPLPAADAS